MQSKAATVTQYLAELPPDRRALITAVRKVIRDNLNKGFEEGMQYGMIGYFVPHRIYPAGYHANPSQPVPFACIASQKNYCSLYLMTVYGDGPHWKRFQEDWAKSGKKLDMGKSCVRFRALDDLALDVVARAIRGTTVEAYLAKYHAALGGTRKAARTAGATRKAHGATATRKPRGAAGSKKAARHTRSE